MKTFQNIVSVLGFVCVMAATRYCIECWIKPTPNTPQINKSMREALELFNRPLRPIAPVKFEGRSNPFGIDPAVRPGFPHAIENANDLLRMQSSLPADESSNRETVPQ